MVYCWRWIDARYLLCGRTNCIESSKNPEIVLLGTNNGLYRTTNAGSYWDTTSIKGTIPGFNFIDGYPISHLLVQIIIGQHINLQILENLGLQ